MRRKIVAVLIFGLGGIAILLALGNWQLKRLVWKEGVIAEIEARLSADPVPLPALPDPVGDKYMRVTVTGQYGPGEVHVLSAAQPWGPGYRIIAPFVTDTGRHILIDRGYVPQPAKDTPRDAPAATVTGALLWADEMDSFTPDPDLGANIWFARDPDGLAAQLGTEPVMIVTEANPGDWPKAMPISVKIKNDHLGYAVTWFGLAAVWAVMTVVVLLRLRRSGAI
jgi:surfeit locus 1 family protein